MCPKNGICQQTPILERQLGPLEMAEQEAIGLLEQLARDFNVRDPRKLFQIARREFPDRRDLTSARAAAALRGDVARQILDAQAKEPGEVGSRGAQRPAAGGPGGARRLHPGDRHQGAARQAGGNGDAGGRGDHPGPGPGGGQLRGHHGPWQRVPGAGNATAVVDRAIQTLKKDLAGMVARRGGGWGEHVDEAAEAYNARPHEAVTVAPEDVETKPAATFRVFQDNAEKFQHNKRLTEGRQRRLQEAGAFRAPTNAARSFQPQFGPARDLASFDSMVVRGTDGSETLLKHALPVPRGSAEPVARLTRRPVPLAVRQLRDFNRAPQPRLLLSYEQYCTLGIFAYGGNDPCLSKASANKEACVALNHFLRAQLMKLNSKRSQTQSGTQLRSIRDK